MACLDENQVVAERVLGWLVDLPPRDELRDPLANTIEVLLERHLLEQPEWGTVRLHPLIREYARGQSPKGVAARAAGRANDALLTESTFEGATGDTLLALGGDLKSLRSLLAGAGEAAAPLHRLTRLLDLGAHHLRHGFDPLPGLYRQARMLDDDALAGLIEGAQRRHGRAWLRHLWTTHGTDPALVRILQGHERAVRGCALSADGRWELSASNDGAVQQWDLNKGVKRPKICMNPVTAAARAARSRRSTRTVCA